MAEAMVSMDYIAMVASDVRQRKFMSATGQSYARRSTVVPSCARQMSIFSFSLPEHWKVGVSVFPERKEILI
jgi:hypothetical protein